MSFLWHGLLYGQLAESEWRVVNGCGCCCTWCGTRESWGLGTSKFVCLRPRARRRAYGHHCRSSDFAAQR
eukprot:2469322-Prymnesium_polylepis.1